MVYLVMSSNVMYCNKMLVRFLEILLSFKNSHDIKSLSSVYLIWILRMKKISHIHTG